MAKRGEGGRHHVKGRKTRGGRTKQNTKPATTKARPHPSPANLPPHNSRTFEDRMQLSLWPQPALQAPQQQPAHRKAPQRPTTPPFPPKMKIPAPCPFLRASQSTLFVFSFFCSPVLPESRRRITTNFAPCLTGARLRQVSAAGVPVPQSPALGPPVTTLPPRRG